MKMMIQSKENWLILLKSDLFAIISLNLSLDRFLLLLKQSLINQLSSIMKNV